MEQPYLIINSNGHQETVMAEKQKDVDKAIDQAIEIAYRRGFHQGVAACVEAVEIGKDVGKLQAWERRLSVWRRKNDCRSREYPEWLARGSDEDIQKIRSYAKRKA
jgi:hypothetical protein